jgi:hypothetical protein
MGPSFSQPSISEISYTFVALRPLYEQLRSAGKKKQEPDVKATQLSSDKSTNITSAVPHFTHSVQIYMSFIWICFLLLMVSKGNVKNVIT